MQPPSIQNFEKFYWASLLAGVLSIIFNWDYIISILLKDPNLELVKSAVGPIIVIGVIIGLAINITLWFYITQKPRKIAKWIFAVFTVYSIITGLPALFVAPFSTVILGTISTILSAGALYMLSRPDAVTWFDTKPQQRNHDDIFK